MEKISKTFFDIILVDLFLPQMNGLRFAQEYRKRMPKAKIILLIEDGQLPVLKRTGQTRLDFPSILKSFVSHILPQLLSEELNSMSEKT
ncbi:hypothetical protein GWN42_24060 [candidate division KSB1 bacterium]|nr:hypothetical protein [candidate division KSB1 bacterium]